LVGQDYSLRKSNGNKKDSMDSKKESKPKLKNYVLLSGRDDEEFCRRVSDRMDAGYELYGSPAMTFNVLRGYPMVSQALVLKKKSKSKK
jgi:hypothetical protein